MTVVSFAVVPGAVERYVVDDERGIADAAAGGGPGLGVPAPARDHGRLRTVPLQDAAGVARPGAAARRQGPLHLQAEPVGRRVGHAALLAGVAELTAEERRARLHRAHQRRPVILRIGSGSDDNWSRMWWISIWFCLC